MKVRPLMEMILHADQPAVLMNEIRKLATPLLLNGIGPQP